MEKLYTVSIKKNEILPFATTWMDPEIVILSEVSQTKTNIYYIIFMQPKMEKLYTVSKNKTRS